MQIHSHTICNNLIFGMQLQTLPYQLYSYLQFFQSSLKFLNTAIHFFFSFNNHVLLLFSKTQFTRFPVYFLPPSVVSAKIKDNHFFPSSLLELVSVTSFPGSYEAMQDKTLVKTIIITFTFSNTEFSTSKIVMNPLAYEIEILPSLSFLLVVMQLRRVFKNVPGQFSNSLKQPSLLFSLSQFPMTYFTEHSNFQTLSGYFYPCSSLLALLSLFLSHSFKPPYITYSTTP